MTQYIDKDALVAEIEKRTDELYDLLPDASKVENGMITISEACNTGKYTALESFKGYIDTLEVKEVDLEKELDSMITPELKFHKALPSLFDVAKHFFELGLRSAITEEDCKLIWNIGDEIPNMPEEEFFKELLKRYKERRMI
jgi:uncharacterized protein YbaR (Trm112 family)